MSLFDCPPTILPLVDGAEPSILELASRASHAANAWRDAMDERAPFKVMMMLAGTLARTTSELTTAIADAVAESDVS